MSLWISFWYVVRFVNTTVNKPVLISTFSNNKVSLNFVWSDFQHQVEKANSNIYFLQIQCLSDFWGVCGQFFNAKLNKPVLTSTFSKNKVSLIFVWSDFQHQVGHVDPLPADPQAGSQALQVSHLLQVLRQLVLSLAARPHSLRNQTLQVWDLWAQIHSGRPSYVLVCLEGDINWYYMKLIDYSSLFCFRVFILMR